MARYRKIDPRIWNDEKFASLSHEGQRMFLFVLTHPSMTSLGAFRISREGMAAELGLDEKGFAEPFAELLQKGLVMYDERVFLVFAPNFLKYNAPENPNVVKGWGTALDFLPECPLLVDVLIRAKVCASTSSGLLKAFENTLGRVLETLSKRYSKPFEKGMAKQEQEQEQDISTNVDKKEKIKKEKKSKLKTVLSKPDDVSSDQIWSDFNALRNAKHAPLTETALNIIRKEAEKAGITLEQALETCCMRGWQGFKAEWYLKGQNNSRFQSYGPRDIELEFRPEDYEGGLISDLLQR
ncbi:hypothetical protein [Parasutterella secunda]|uniref:Uncharacterized protein n=1 Tax=Parasutterella secunda TaxID=626947 RepID=A0ABS2GTP0_9BURK|nr:hypothetical protein [Parasutterella secunda]MBM6928166.1 hypothetical protein [Parasutterella secunda]